MTQRHPIFISDIWTYETEQSWPWSNVSLPFVLISRYDDIKDGMWKNNEHWICDNRIGNQIPPPATRTCLDATMMLDVVDHNDIRCLQPKYNTEEQSTKIGDKH